MLHTRTPIEYRAGGGAAILPTIVDRVAEESNDRRKRLAAEQAMDQVLADSFRPVTRPRGILGSRFWIRLGVWNATLSVPRASQIRPHRRERPRSSTCLDRLVQAEPSSRASCRLLAPPVLRCLSRSRFSWSDFQSHSPFEVCSSYSAGSSASASGRLATRNES